MTQLIQQATYQYIVKLQGQELAKAETPDEKLKVLLHFSSMREAVFQREWESFNTAA
ncbi:hypothetical protein QYZ44_21560 [Vibrio parahaemolyticus]|nr:hypothetical protein [Vibrio parahaemolyticus]MDN4711622.1 hypothetical protein [Vibrio parahaemolyticus]